MIKPKLKPLTRIAAFDDGYFKPRTKSKALLVGVISRLDGRVEGIVSARISVDGFDSTAKIVSMLSKSRFFDQARFIMLSGINFAGFNIVDVRKLNQKLKKPVIVVFRKQPKMERIYSALEKLSRPGKRKELIELAGPVHRAGSVRFQVYGVDVPTARRLIKRLTLHSNMPEPLRLSHLIASGVTIGESTKP